MRLFSWNVNGIRAVLNKGALDSFLEKEKPDVVCLQEIKAKKNQVEVDFKGYEEVWNPAERAGYAGTATFIKNGLEFSTKTTDLPVIKDDYGEVTSEGRVLTTEFPDFYLVNVYTPNSKRDLSRLQLRKGLWDPTFLDYLKKLEKEKPVITCGDFNAAHTEIDLARPKENTRNAGFTLEERQGIENMLKSGFIDTFRSLNPTAERYTWWSHWGKARERNVGWRIDYFFISQELMPYLRKADILESVMGSDHCPVLIELDFSRKEG